MDNQAIANAYGVTPDQANNLEVAPSRGMQGPTYQSPTQVNPYVPQQQQPQPGLFDSVPFHSWLAKSKKEPWNMSDDEIKNSVEDYANGPLRTILGHHINQSGKFPSDKAREAALNDELGYYKMLAQNEVAQSLPAIRGHLQSLKPQGATAPTSTQTPLETLGKGIESLPAALTSFGAMAAGGLGRAADYLVDPVTAGAGATPISGAKPIQDLQDTAFNIANKSAKAAKDIRGTPGEDLASRAASTVASLPEGIMTAGMSQSIENARNAIQQGQDFDTVKKNLAIDAATNVLASRLPGGNALVRAAKGALYNPILQNANAFLKGEKTPDATDNLLSSLFGAGFGAALGRRPGEKPPVNEKGTTNETQTQTSADAGRPSQGEEALAAQATGEPTNAGRTNEPVATATLDPKYAVNEDAILKADSPEKAQALYDSQVESVPPEQLDAFNTHFLDEVNAAHDITPDQIKQKTSEPAAPAQASRENPPAPSTAEAPTPSAAVQPNVEGLLSEPVSLQVMGEKGRATNKRVPVDFQNPTDKLAYLYKNGDEETRPLIADELVKRGVPTERIQEYADKVGKDVASSVNALKHKVILSDRGFNKPETTPLKRTKPPKA